MIKYIFQTIITATKSVVLSSISTLERLIDFFKLFQPKIFESFIFVIFFGIVCSKSSNECTILLEETNQL